MFDVCIGISLSYFTRNNGFPNDGTTSALVFGCGVACYSLGSGVGAPISGLLYDHFGFRLAEIFIPGTEILMVRNNEDTFLIPYLH